MISVGYTELDSFRAANALLRDSSSSKLSASFDDVLENQAKEAASKAKEKSTEVVDNSSDSKKKKAGKNSNEGLPNVSELIQNVDRKNSLEVQKTYNLLEKFREDRKSFDEELPKGAREQTLSNAYNIAGQALIQPVYDQGQRRMSKSQMLNVWEKYTPSVTEDITKKSVRIDIPLLNDVQALVLRLNPDRSLTASLLGSKAMSKLIKENKDKLDRNLRHHHLSLREFNTYNSELAFNTESGTKKKKRQAKLNKKAELDLI